MDENKKALLQKLKALAEQGVGGEKINAQKLLNALMQQYGISDADLDDSNPVLCEFKCKSDIEEKLLIQTIFKVTNSRSMYTFSRRAGGRTIKHLWGCKCTAAQRVEIEFLFDFYKRVFVKDFDIFVAAFIQKHAIFGDTPSHEEPRRIDLEKLMRMEMLQKGLSDEKPVRQIEGKK